MSQLPNPDRQLLLIKRFALFPFWVLFRLRRETRKFQSNHPWYNRSVSLSEFADHQDQVVVTASMLTWFLAVILLNAAIKIAAIARGCK